MSRPSLLLLTSLPLLFLAGPAAAQTGSGVTTTAVAPAPATTTNPGGKLTTEFSGLAGSPENAAALVQGLRSGSAVTLTGPGPLPGTVETTTFTAPTRPMGYGNVRIALALAQNQLASQGIVNPTPQQLQAALVGLPASPGGSSGILQMRASGMGWGQIAHSLGTKLGAVMGGRQTLAAGAPAGTGTTTAVGGKASGITTAAGAAGNHGKGSNITTAAGGHGKGSNITTAAGGGGQGRGIATGLGHGGGSAGVVTAAGGQGHAMGGNGLAKGHGKP